MKTKDSIAAKPRGLKDAKHRPTRKASYRPLQYSLVVASFVASFMGATWLQARDGAADSVQALVQESDVVIASQPSLAVLAPTPTVGVPVTSQAQPALAEQDEAETGAVELSREPDDEVLAAPEIVLPTNTPVPTPSVAAAERVPNVVARSRSSR